MFTVIPLPFCPAESKAYLPMFIAVALKLISVRPVQPLNAYSPRLVTLSGIVTEVRPVQSENALAPMLVTLSGIVIDVRPVQSENAEEPMLVTLPSAGITLVLQPKISVLLAVSIRQFPVL